MRRAKKLVSTKEIADFVTLESMLAHVPISERTLHRYIASGKLRAYKLDGKLIFSTPDIEAFLKRRSVGGGTTAPILKDKPADAPAESRVLNDDEAKKFFDNLPVFLQPGWEPPKLFEFKEEPDWQKNVNPAEKAEAEAAALALMRQKSQK